MAISATPEPRELAPNLWWLGDCIHVNFEGQDLHNGNWVYLLRGERSSLLIETGAPPHLPVIEEQLDRLLATGPPLEHIWASHQETPHAGGIARLLTRYPDAVLRGDVRDYHLFFPELEDRFVPLGIDESIDLGGTEFTAVEGIINDLPTTQWGFDSERRALFTSDGFAYSHVHAEGQCRSLVEEAPTLPVENLTALFALFALFWTTLVDVEPYIERVRELVDRLGVEMVVPSHGLPIGDVTATVPRVYEGVRVGSGWGGRGGVDLDRVL